MPITQDRMIRVVTAASALADAHTALYRLMRDNMSIVAEANSVAAHTADANARASISRLVAMLGTIGHMINEATNENIEGIVKAKAEKEYFARVQRKNERQAIYARQKRYVDQHIDPEPAPARIAPELAPLPLLDVYAGSLAPTPTQDADLTQTPEFQAFQRAMQEKYAREKHLYPGVQDDTRPAADAEPGANAVAHTHIQPRTDASGTTRWLPSDDELNARPNNSDKDLL